MEDPSVLEALNAPNIGEHLALSLEGFAEKPCFLLDRCKESQRSSLSVQKARGDEPKSNPQCGI
jgi:hypothetical protein